LAAEALSPAAAVGIAGPLAGILFVLAACVPFYVNAGTYAASAVLIGLVAGTYRASRAAADGDANPRSARRVRQELAEGFRWLAGQPDPASASALSEAPR
jgi:hypothetical protein